MKDVTNIAAITAHLWVGFDDAHRAAKAAAGTPEEDTALYEQHANSLGGMCGIVCAMATHAEAVEGMEKDLAKRFGILDYPGVFAYEVVEPLGAWLYANPDDFYDGGPSDRFISQATVELVDWFRPTPTRSSALPVVVVDVGGGLVHNVRMNVPVRVIVLDGDTEGCDPLDISEIEGAGVLVTEYGHGATTYTLDPDSVNAVVRQVHAS